MVLGRTAKKNGSIIVVLTQTAFAFCHLNHYRVVGECFQYDRSDILLGLDLRRLGPDIYYRLRGNEKCGYEKQDYSAAFNFVFD